VGSVVLPVLGAVPDGAIVLFSGMGKDADKKLSVGVGALAGSTIMLLTIPWFLASLAGRVDLGSDRDRPVVQEEDTTAKDKINEDGTEQTKAAQPKEEVKEKEIEP
jgi:Ca2+/Na+ antiporter